MSAGAPAARLVLASASPRRRALLAQAGLTFEIDPAGVDEEVAAGLDPIVAARVLAERKARAVAERTRGAALVLGADTIVALGEEPGATRLGKPAGPAEARAMLRTLSDTRHVVVTGVCVVRTFDRAAWLGSERTFVRMRALAALEIEAYVASEEWRDKAGGYAIQESADRFVSELSGGGFDNVVGLPVALSLALLSAAGGAPCR